MSKRLAQAIEEIEKDNGIVWFTIVDEMGSTPRKTGCHALLHNDGTVEGTVGGGYQEYLVWETGRTCLHTGRSQLIHINLHQGGTDSIDAACGGEVSVFCQYLDSAIEGVVPAVKAIGEAMDQHTTCRIWTDVTTPDSWGMAVLQDGRSPIFAGTSDALQTLLENPSYHEVLSKQGLHTVENRRIYHERLTPANRVIIFGGGHVSQALVPVLTGIGFSCTVVDDRSEFANTARFPQAEATIVADFQHLEEAITIHSSDYVCIMTRGHVADYEAQWYALLAKPCYIGVIGSRAKHHFVQKKLRAQGFTEEDISFCHGPIGLPISAITPAEIAISIAGELIAVRAQLRGREKADAKLWREYWNEHNRT